VISPRQPGSALKPFTYASAFERGASPGQVLADVPSQFRTAEAGVLYSPRNYDGQFRGPLLARAALAGSETSCGGAGQRRRRPGDRAPASSDRLHTLSNNARTTVSVSRSATRKCDSTSWSPPTRRSHAVAITAGRCSSGRSTARRRRGRLGTARLQPHGVLDHGHPRRRRRPRSIFGRGGSLEFPFTGAAKTGTSQAYHDNWAIGYTKDVTVGVWVGNFDRTPLRDGERGKSHDFHSGRSTVTQVCQKCAALPTPDTARRVADHRHRRRRQPTSDVYPRGDRMAA
jgi:penicillin-binding protein 1C